MSLPNVAFKLEVAAFLPFQTLTGLEWYNCLEITFSVYKQDLTFLCPTHFQVLLFSSKYLLYVYTNFKIDF